MRKNPINTEDDHTIIFGFEKYRDYESLYNCLYSKILSLNRSFLKMAP